MFPEKTPEESDDEIRPHENRPKTDIPVRFNSVISARFLLISEINSRSGMLRLGLFYLRAGIFLTAE